MYYKGLIILGDVEKHLDHWKKDTFAEDARLVVFSIWILLSQYTHFLLPGRIPDSYFSFCLTSSPLDIFCSLTTFTAFLISPNLIILKNIYTLKTLTFIYPTLPTALNSNSQHYHHPSSAPPTDFSNSVVSNSNILVTQAKNLTVIWDCFLLQPTSNLIVNLDGPSSKYTQNSSNLLSYIHSLSFLLL